MAWVWPNEEMNNGSRSVFNPKCYSKQMDTFLVYLVRVKEIVRTANFSLEITRLLLVVLSFNFNRTLTIKILSFPS